MDLEEMVGASVIAEVLGLKKTRVNELVANGVLHPVGSPRKYNLKQAIHDYISYIKGLNDPTKQEEKDLEKNKLKAEAVYKGARAKKAQLELAELEGTMHRSEDVQAFAEQLIYGTRSMLLALPGRAAIDAHNAQSIEETSNVLRREIEQVLSTLATYKYDPEFFSERVKDRNGWIGQIDTYTGAAGGKPEQVHRQGNNGVQAARKPNR